MTEEELPEPANGLWLIVRNQVAIIAALHATFEILGGSAKARGQLLERVKQSVGWLERATEKED